MIALAVHTFARWTLRQYFEQMNSAYNKIGAQFCVLQLGSKATFKGLRKAGLSIFLKVAVNVVDLS